MAQFASNPFQVVYLFSNKKITIYPKKTKDKKKNKKESEGSSQPRSQASSSPTNSRSVNLKRFQGQGGGEERWKRTLGTHKSQGRWVIALSKKQTRGEKKNKNWDRKSRQVWWAGWQEYWDEYKASSSLSTEGWAVVIQAAKSKGKQMNQPVQRPKSVKQRDDFVGLAQKDYTGQGRNW